MENDQPKTAVLLLEVQWWIAIGLISNKNYLKHGTVDFVNSLE